MNITIKVLVCWLLGWAGIANAFDVIGQEMYDTYDSKVFDHIATSVSEVGKSSGYYQIDVFAISVKNDKHPQGLLEAMKSSLPTIDKELWTITFNQLPVSENLCEQLNLIPCEKNNDYCYKPCFGNLPPQVMAFDSINNKIYFHYPTYDIGTGGGPALLFEGDINKKEIKFLRLIAMGTRGSISPTGRYFVTHGYSIIYIYDRVNKIWVEANQSENHYDDHHRRILHNLDVKKWINDTQFTYVDSANYFITNADEMPFISAKEVIYDISTKKKLSEKSISKNEYDDFIKSLPLQARY